MTIGMGDWFPPNCDTPGSVPGQPACGVPHWYCYIPGMATPDCLASLQEGMQEIGGSVGSAVGGMVNAVGSGAGSALAGSLTSSGSGTLILVGIAAVIAFSLFMGRR